jgi:type VI secretion system protein ImpH
VPPAEVAALDATAPLPPDADPEGGESDLRARLASEPWSFEFFQAVRLLEQLSPDRDPVGGFDDPRDEAVRFRSRLGVSFPPSEIAQLTEGHDGQPPQLTVNFMGLTGPQGVLPLNYSLMLSERARAGDHAMRDFFEIFDHRMISLFYRAWGRSRAAVGNAVAGRDFLTRHLLDLLGLGLPEVRDQLPISDDALLGHAGLLLLPTRPAVALEQIIAEAFGVPAEVEQFVGGWYPLDRTMQCELGTDDESTQLGLGAAAGDEIFDLQARARVRLGPLTRHQYDRFLPGGDAHERLRALTRFFGNDQIDFELQLVLRRDEVPACTLAPDDGPLALGWSTWLRTGPLARDPDDTILPL